MPAREPGIVTFSSGRFGSVATPLLRLSGGARMTGKLEAVEEVEVVEVVGSHTHSNTT